MRFSKIVLTLVSTIVIHTEYHAQWACNYDNAIYQTVTAPSAAMQTVTSTCVYGGEFVRVNNLIEGRTYYINTCGNTNFDTQISIYTEGGGLECAYNDDYCGVQSAIYFTPLTSGNYDILVDEYICASNSICMDLDVQLWNIPHIDITIPVVVHVVYNNAAENISDAQILSQIPILNQTFSRTNLDIYNVESPLRGTSADPMIQFCMAERDPNGDPTTGITRSYTPFTDFNIPFPLCNASQCVFDNTLGGEDPWDPNEYLNIWVCNMPGPSLVGTIGYGFPPWPVLAPYDGIGIVIDYRTVGNIGTATAPFTNGRNAVHEVGHWLNLLHTFGLNSLPADCSSDSVVDTPWQDLPSIGMPTFPFTDGCSPNLPGINFYDFMDYSWDASRSMFTYGQVYRTDQALLGPYSSFQSSLGCVPGSAPATNFIANPTSGQAPLSVNFTDLSSNTPNLWNWSFPGANTTSSSSQNPSGIVYPSPGTYNVTLTSSNSWGNDVETKSSYIVVSSGVGVSEQSLSSSIKIFPNPSAGTFVIESNSENPYSVGLIDVLGKLVKTFDVSSGINEIDCSDCQTGVYTLRFHSEDGDFNQKLVIE
tara:strand:- start:167 stop:1939 length:1773 start_codon:yes stop_codon:yes gene_type:complete